MPQPETLCEDCVMDSSERPVPALVPPAMVPTGDGLVMPARRECPAGDVPAPFAGLRWRLVPDLAGARRLYAKP